MTLQPTAILFPDAELWATGRIRGELAGRVESYAQNVYVSNAIPATRRDRMVVVRRDGGPARGLFDHPRLSVQVWAKSDQDATDLARLVSALMRLLPGDGVCTAISQNSGPNPVADTSGQPLRYMVFDATTRGEML